MKQLFLLAMFSFMFFSCVDKKAEVQEEVIIEEVDTTLLEETETL